jgi:hypothetical protein
MARGKNRNRLFGRRSRSSKTAEARTTRSVGSLPFLRFPPDSKKPSKTTKSKTSRGGLFGRTKKDRVKTTLPTKGAPIGNSKSTIGIALSTENWRYRSNDDRFTGPYHKGSDGKFYSGSRPKRRGLFGRRKSRAKEVYKLDIPTTLTPDIGDGSTTTIRPDVAKPYTGKGGAKPSRGGGLVVTTAPYKPIDSYGNQYPAEDSSVAPAKDSINPQYTSGGLRGHFHTEQLGSLAVSYEGTPPSLSQVKTVSVTSMEFILEFDGEFFTSGQYKEKLNRAASENNPYFRIDRNAVPIISFNTSNPTFSSYSDKFKEEDDYAMVDVDYKLAVKDIWIRHIDYITRKTSVNQGVRTPEQIYSGGKPWTVRDTVSDIDAILETSGKPPKVRFKGGTTGPAVPAKTSPPPKRKKKKIICNELYQQGYLPEHIWDADERWGDKTFITDPKLVIGYQMWARKVVEYMRRKPQHTPIIYFLCKPWTEWMAYDLGVLPKNNLKGQLTQFVGRYFSYAVYDLFGGDALYKRYQEIT